MGVGEGEGEESAERAGVAGRRGGVGESVKES